MDLREAEEDHEGGLLSDEPRAPDSTLIDAARGGSVAAFGLLYEQHRPAALRRAQRLLDAGHRSQAEDVVETAFAAVFDAMRNGAGPRGNFYEFLSHEGPFTLTPEYARESLRRYFTVDGEHRELVAAATIPKDLVIIQRIQLGLLALLSDLGATGDWGRLSREWWPWAEEEPFTELGRADLAWRQSRAAAEPDPV